MLPMDDVVTGVLVDARLHVLGWAITWNERASFFSCGGAYETSFSSTCHALSLDFESDSELGDSFRKQIY